jgi:hypothetical protein
MSVVRASPFHSALHQADDILQDTHTHTSCVKTTRKSFEHLAKAKLAILTSSVSSINARRKQRHYKRYTTSFFAAID